MKCVCTFVRTDLGSVTIELQLPLGTFPGVSPVLSPAGR